MRQCTIWRPRQFTSVNTRRHKWDPAKVFVPLVLCRLIFKWKLKAGEECAYTVSVCVCVCAPARRLICATSAQPAQGSSPLEKWVTFPDDVKSPSASPVCGALPKPPHAIPRPYNGNVFSKALMNHLPNLSQFLNLNTEVSPITTQIAKIVSDKGVVSPQIHIFI